MKNTISIIRLNHFLSSSGVCGRRKADTLIKKGLVQVNNKTVENPALRISPEKDKVKLEGRPIKPRKNILYIAFNKPRKVITSMEDPKNRLCIQDYFRRLRERVFPVGRLDWHSEGLILLTNDGDFSLKISRGGIPKTYLVKLNGRPRKNQLARLKKGVLTEIGRLRALYVEELPKKSSKHSWVKVVLQEGRNRQLHRMFEKIGFQIKVLRRVAIGKLKLKSLKPGESYLLSERDLQKVFSLPSEVQNEKKFSKMK